MAAPVRRWLRPHLVLDWFLMERVFTPIAHYMDYRWHVNRFKLALWSLKFGLSAQIAGTLGGALIGGSWIGWNAVFFSGLLLVTCRTYFTTLPEASAACERDPSQITWGVAGLVFFPPPMRGAITVMAMSAVSVMGTVGLELGSANICVQTLYLPGYCSMVYFAATPPSGRDRRKKKERHPWIAPFPRLAANRPN